MTEEPQDDVDRAQPEPVRTGVSRVDSVVDDVAGLGSRPLEEHVQVFEAAHERLRRALDHADDPTHDPTHDATHDAGPGAGTRAGTDPA